MMAFHKVRYRARGLYFVITKPAVSKPAADEIKAKLPVNMLEAEAD